MATTATYQCKECGKPFEARTADRARGWARFCSKSCKAIRQTKKSSGRKYPRHDGHSPMKFKVCADCGAPAVNGLRMATGIKWFCSEHMAANSTHPHDPEALGQW